MKNINFSEIINQSKKFVAPVWGEAHDGCGVFVGNRFITAGHVTKPENFPSYVDNGGKRYQLDNSNLLSRCFSEQLTAEPGCGDYAVFSTDGVNSPLQIANYCPKEGQQLLCIYYDTDVTNTPEEGIPSVFTQDEDTVLKTTIVTVRKESQGNFFAVDSDDLFKVGNSGSPLFDADGKIVGFLHGGHLNTPCCIFQYANSIDI